MLSANLPLTHILRSSILTPLSTLLFQGHKDPDPPIAVSCLRNGAAVRQKDFIAHVAMLSSIPSPHLVALLGYCMEGEEKMLVHELMINGSLHDRLHGKTSAEPE